MEDYGYVKWEDRNNPENGGKTESWQDIWQSSMDALEEKDQNLIEKYGELENQYVAGGGYELQIEINKLLTAFGFKESEGIQ